jgi:hypothetical protein
MSKLSVAQSERFPMANGTLRLPLGPWGFGRDVEIFGGPYARGYEEDPKHFGIVLVENEPVNFVRGQAQKVAFDRHIPINDFSIPKQPIPEIQAAIRDAIRASILGKHVYVGCMGGWGRTGLFLSLMTKTMGVSDPIHYVRKHYTPKAVETAEQEKYVIQFPVEDLRWDIMTWTFQSFMAPWFPWVAR